MASVPSSAGPVVVKFNFNTTAQSVSGWIDVSGNPHSGIRTATDGGSGIGITSIAIGNPYWDSYVSITSSNTGGETAGNASFPATVMGSYWFEYSTISSTEANANIRITGLNEAKTYKIEMYSSRLASAVGTATRRTQFIMWHNGGSTTISNYDAKGNVSTSERNSGTGGTTGGIATFNSVVPKTGGLVNIRMNPTAGEDFGYINGMIITEL
jgi:hypothetical protein